MKYRNRKNAEATARYWGKSLDNPNWYEVKAEEESDSSEIFIYDVIGWPFNDARELVQRIAGMTAEEITVRINSPGGDVFDGFALFNALDKYDGKVTTKIEGIAASMASVVALAGNTTMHKNSMMMIHEPWTFAVVNQHEARELADILGKISGNILDEYHRKAKKGKKDLQTMMKDETWFTAGEAKEIGLINSIIDEPAAQASFDLSMYDKAPESVMARPEGRELNEREIERALRDAGASRTFAKAMVAGNYKALRDAELQNDIYNLINTIKRQ